MKTLVRSLAALLLGALSVFAAGLPASALDAGCPAQNGDYGANNVCVVHVLNASPVCTSGVLRLTYAVSREGTDASVVDLHWTSTTGADVVLVGQPLSGTVTWPNSVAKGPTNVRFTVGADATVRVDPTDTLEGCTVSGVLAASDTSASGVLASTGSETLPLVAIGAGLLLAGALVLLVRNVRARRTAE